MQASSSTQQQQQQQQQPQPQPAPTRPNPAAVKQPELALSPWARNLLRQAWTLISLSLFLCTVFPRSVWFCDSPCTSSSLYYSAWTAPNDAAVIQVFTLLSVVAHVLVLLVPHSLPHAGAFALTVPAWAAALAGTPGAMQPGWAVSCFLAGSASSLLALLTTQLPIDVVNPGLHAPPWGGWEPEGLPTLAFAFAFGAMPWLANALDSGLLQAAAAFVILTFCAAVFSLAWDMGGLRHQAAAWTQGMHVALLVTCTCVALCAFGLMVSTLAAILPSYRSFHYAGFLLGSAVAFALQLVVVRSKRIVHQSAPPMSAREWTRRAGMELGLGLLMASLLVFSAAPDTFVLLTVQGCQATAVTLSLCAHLLAKYPRAPVPCGAALFLFANLGASAASGVGFAVSVGTGHVFGQFEGYALFACASHFLVFALGDFGCAQALHMAPNDYDFEVLRLREEVEIERLKLQRATLEARLSKV